MIMKKGYNFTFYTQDINHIMQEGLFKSAEKL